MSENMMLVAVGILAGIVVFVHFWWTSSPQSKPFVIDAAAVQPTIFVNRETPLDIGSEQALNDWMQITDGRTFMEYCYTETWDERCTNSGWIPTSPTYITKDWYEIPIQAYGKTSSISLPESIEPYGVTGSIPNPNCKPVVANTVMRSFSW